MNDDFQLLSALGAIANQPWGERKGSSGYRDFNSKVTSNGQNAAHIAAILRNYQLFLTFAEYCSSLLEQKDLLGKSPFNYFLESWCDDVIRYKRIDLAIYLPSLLDRFEATDIQGYFHADENFFKRYLLNCGDSYVIRKARESLLLQDDDLSLIIPNLTIEHRNILADSGFGDDLPSINALKLKLYIESESYDFKIILSLLNDIIPNDPLIVLISYGDQEIIKESMLRLYSELSEDEGDLVKKSIIDICQEYDLLPKIALSLI
jgi:hypothetical protein